MDIIYLLFYSGLCFHLVLTAQFGDVCYTDDDCDDVNTACIKTLECASGTCQCISGFGNADGTGCEKELSHYGEPCGNGRICNDSNQQCGSTSQECECSTWNTYSASARACTTVTYKLLGETCGGWWQEECLVDSANGGTCDVTCQCADGYSKESLISCRAPTLGERCVGNPACQAEFDTTTISDDATSIAPTCLLNTCRCPPSHDTKYVMGYNLCISKISDSFVQKDNGETCRNFNDCKSYLCVKCAGAASGVCMADPFSGSVKFHFTGSWGSVCIPAFLAILLTT